MPITSTLISSSNTTTDNTSYDLALAKAWNAVINDVFSQIHDVLSKVFVRVDENAESFVKSSGTMFFRESYALDKLTDKYLVVQLNVPPNPAVGTTDMTVCFIFTSQIVPTSLKSVSGLKLINALAKLQHTSGSILHDDNSYTYISTVALRFYVTELKNDYVSLYAPNPNTSHGYLCTSGAIGKAIINDTVYWMALMNPSGDLCVFDKQGVQCWIAKKLLLSYSGGAGEGCILTIPAYFANATENSNNNNTIIYNNMPLKDALITDGSKTPYGAIYKVGGVDYFALWSKILIKL